MVSTVRILKVKSEVEELVEVVSKKLGYTNSTVRNTAILLGLANIHLLNKIPETDAEFLELLNNVRRMVVGND